MPFHHSAAHSFTQSDFSHSFLAETSFPRQARLQLSKPVLFTTPGFEPPRLHYSLGGMRHRYHHFRRPPRAAGDDAQDFPRRARSRCDEQRVTAVGTWARSWRVAAEEDACEWRVRACPVLTPRERQRRRRGAPECARTFADTDARRHIETINGGAVGDAGRWHAVKRRTE